MTSAMRDRRVSARMFEAVGDLLREASETIILPRFKALSEGEIEEKTPGELVTVADREAETFIARGLAGLGLSAGVIGEEACSHDASLLEEIHENAVWLIDPIDGTGNFVAGHSPFAIMVALLVDGETVAAWILDPITDRLAMAERGGGAYIDGVRIRTVQDSDLTLRLSGIIGRFMPSDVHAGVMKRAGTFFDLRPGLKCAGAEYPVIALEDRHFAFFWRTLPWDHASGALFLAEAGGMVSRPDGTPYSPGKKGNGLLIAHNPGIWRVARHALFG